MYFEVMCLIKPYEDLTYKERLYIEDLCKGVQIK